MIKLTVAASKGGTGKSSAAILVACALAASGQRVLLVDADGPQHSAASWAERGSANYPTLPWAGLKIARTSSALDVQQLDLAAGAFDWVVLDTAPSTDSGLLRAIVDQADYILIPTAPTALCAEALGQVLRDVVLPSGRPYSVVLWGVDGRRPTATDAVRQQLRELGADVLDAAVRRLLPIETAPATGLPADRWRGRTGAAARDDVTGVVAELLLRMISLRQAAAAGS